MYDNRSRENFGSSQEMIQSMLIYSSIIAMATREARSAELIFNEDVNNVDQRSG